MRAANPNQPGLDLKTITGELGQFRRQLNKWGGTSKTSSSKTADARAEYRKALDINPAMTDARARLAALD